MYMVLLLRMYSQVLLVVIVDGVTHVYSYLYACNDSYSLPLVVGGGVVVVRNRCLVLGCGRTLLASTSQLQRSAHQIGSKRALVPRTDIQLRVRRL